MTRKNGPTRRRAMLAVTSAILALAAATLASADQAPGGLIEGVGNGTLRPVPTPSEIQAFLPTRGQFTFPAPYDTQGFRITNAGDCGGNDCVDYIGYSYWRNMSNSVGTDTMYIFIGLNRNKGGPGPTLFRFDKTAQQLTKVGPLFDPSSPLSWATGEGWYFSYSMPTKLYVNEGPKMLRYDVLNKTFETVFDASTRYGSNVRLWQMSSSNDDNVHAATLQSADTHANLGCVAYRADTNKFFFYPKTGAFDECQIDKSGRWLVIKEKTSSTCASCDVDNVIVDLQTDTRTILSDQDGAGGHSDLGYGYMVAADNWNTHANAWRLWDLGHRPLTGGLVTYDPNWSVFAPEHVSFENARPGVPVSQQYACGSAANRVNVPHANEITCFMLDASVPADTEQVLVVAPVMTDLDASGGGTGDYAKEPKGNLDPTGRYFIWTSNMGGTRLDAFMVKIPSQLLTGAGSSASGGQATVTITSPPGGAAVTGKVAVTANASSPSGVAGVQFQLDGTNVGNQITKAPYTFQWNSDATSAGPHTLSAVLTDDAGHAIRSAPLAVSVGVPSGGSGTTAAVRSGISAGGGTAPAALAVLLIAWLYRRRLRAGGP